MLVYAPERVHGNPAPFGRPSPQSGQTVAYLSTLLTEA